MSTLVPIIEQIALGYLAALQRVRTTNVMPGSADKWPITIQATRRIPNGNIIDDQAVLLLQDDSEADLEKTWSTTGVLYWRQRWIARCYVCEPETPDPTEQYSIDTRINEIAACVQLALMADPHLGNLVEDTYLLSCVLYAPDATSGVDVNFECIYRVSLENPFSLG